MKLTELFRQLALGELSNLAFAKDGFIAEAAHSKVINAITVALNDIYSRLLLSEKEVMIQTLDWKSVYHIRKEHSKLDPTPGFLKYILDMPDNRFTGDLVKVLGVVNEVGAPLPINDPDQWASVFLPSFDTVQFNHPGSGQVFSVLYQALHPDLATEGEGYLDQELRIPPVLMDMVRAKTASTILAPMGGQDHSLKAQVLEAAYEARHTSLVNKNEVGDTSASTNVKLMLRQFP